jgi:4-aminobutyrate aminotransferase-like enzyme
MPSTPTASAAIQHTGEEQSNQLRSRLHDMEPLCLRTQTPSMAVISRSSGSYHWTTDDRKLADFTSGVLVSNLGHNPAGWWKRLLQYLNLNLAGPVGEDGCLMAAPLTTYNATCPVEVEATDRLLQSLRSEAGGSRMEQVLWAASGSEAVQKALWACMARRPGSDMILATRGGFHGKKGLAGAVTGSEDDAERDPRVRFISFPRDECRSIQRRAEPIDLEPYRVELQSLAKEYNGKLCALITEPYLGGGGSYHPQPEYMQLLEQFCREQDIALVLDEIQANFGRTGSMYAFTQYGIEPDIVLLGKGLGNGIPVDCAAGRTDLFQSLGYGEGSDTWSGHPLGCAAVLATLDEFENSPVVENGRKLADVIAKSLLRLSELPAIEAVRGEGTVWGIQCAAVGSRSANEVAVEVVESCYRGNAAGLAIHLLGPLAGCVIRIAPPLVMPIDEAQTYLDCMHEIIATFS